MRLHNSDHHETLIPRLAATQRGARRLHFPKIFFSFESSVPLIATSSHMTRNFRCEPRWLPRLNSHHPSAAAQKSRRLRRQARRTFAPKRNLTLASTTHPVSPPARARKSSPLLSSHRRLDKRASLWTVEVEPELETPQHQPPQAATLCSIAKGSPEREQAKPTPPTSEANPPYTSQPTRAAQKTPTIKIILFQNTKL
jgi:hypothetical protein